MKRPLRILALTAVLLVGFYLVSLLPWIGHFSEERAQQTNMASTAPIHFDVPEARIRKPYYPGHGAKKDQNDCETNGTDPDCIPAQMNRVTDLIDAGRFEEARDLLLEMLKARPGNANILNTLGLVFRYRLDDPERGEQYFKLALTASPDRMDIANQLEELYEDPRNRTDGIKFLSSLSAKNPQSPNLKLSLGSLELLDGANDSALNHLGQALRMEPDMLRGYDLLAEAQAKANLPENAVSTLERLLQIYLDQKKQLAVGGEGSASIDAEITRVRARIAELSGG
jgi:tetratricopeptide (TPR) repeat protein